MKLLFECLESFLVELRDRKVGLVRVSPALAVETGPRVDDLPNIVSRVLVTAALDDQNWAEWRYWVGQAPAQGAGPELQVPMWLREKQDRSLAEVARRVDGAGFLLREGILTHDRGVMDTFRL